MTELTATDVPLTAALDPARSAVVEACAGSGKTWLLVSRMLRLLLAGAAPSELLAITFTRKAAQQMRERLYQWLEELATVPPAAAVDFLCQRGLDEAAAHAALPAARGLFERVLLSVPGPMITTFHGWFLHLLAHAPLKARGPTAVAEDTALLLKEAWLTYAQSLGEQIGSAPEQAMRALLAELPFASVRELLFALVGRRAEWWAYAAGHAQALDAALTELECLAGVRADEDVLAGLFADPSFVADLHAYAALLTRNGAANTQAGRRAATLAQALALLGDRPLPGGRQRDTAWAGIEAVFLTQTGELRSLKDSKAMRARLGEGDAERLLALHAALGERILAMRARLAEQRAVRLNRWGLTAGLGLIEHYQRLKAERDVIDFTDAEWLAWQLVADDELGPAALARLDRRWRHILIDEFQDTNPLQWQVLRAWLEAYGLDGERPTLFLVGDPKQSIYRFRRAEPRLFAQAVEWIRRDWHGLYLPHNTTRRLAPQVTAWVNAVFADRDDYPGFRPHVAHATTLPGGCELILAPRSVAPEPVGDRLRDPLAEPAPEAPEARAEEAQRVAARIAEIVGRVGVQEDGRVRPARYGDIFVLAASRTGLEVFEHALKRAGIPYVGTRRGGLLETLEATDLIALIAWLVNPNDDLALAQTLRCPIFGCSDQHLLALAERDGGSWHARLVGWASEPSAPAEIVRAATLLARWQAAAGRLPAHDLLDRIFHEGELAARYAAAAPPHLRAGVLANLGGLITLSLEFSSGRYPSLPRFLDELRALRDQAGEEAPDEPIAASGDAVRLLTIHAAKGLEAPIVFLIKADEIAREQEHYGVLIDWPAAAAKPMHFSLYGPGQWRGQAREALFALERALAEREQLNLLYVAMTRARQLLVVSGLDDARPGSWLDLLRQGLERAELAGLPAMAACAAAPDLRSAPAAPTPALAVQPIGIKRAAAPEQSEWGVRVHRYLELACRGWEDAAIARDLACPMEEFERIRAQGQALLNAPQLRRFFDSAQYRAAHDELSFVDRDGALRRIDRIVEFTDEVWVLDYKTGGLDEPDLARRAAPYLAQLTAYREAMAALYAGRRVRAALIFADGRMYELQAAG